MPHDPGIIIAVPASGAALLAIFAMGRVACIDLRRLEIDPGWTAVAACAGLAALVAAEGPGALPAAIGTALFAGGAAWIAVRLRPGRIGQGDVTLFAVVGLLTGPQFLAPVLVIGASFLLASCVAYGLARGKRPGRMHRHLVPAGPPLMAALGPVFAWRIVAAARPDLVPDGDLLAAALAFPGVAALAAALVAGALPMAVRRRAVGTKPCGPRGRANQKREETSR